MGELLDKQDKELQQHREQNEILSFNNKRLEKRLSSLMSELQETTKYRRRESFLSGLFGGNSLYYIE